MIPVLIPATPRNLRDGMLCGNFPEMSESMTSIYEIEEDQPVQIVPAEALQSLLTRSQSFKQFQRRFGKVELSEQAEILAAFELIEEWRTGDVKKREQFLVLHTLAVEKRAEESALKGKPYPASLKEFLKKHRPSTVARQGLPLSVTDLLNRKLALRVWVSGHALVPMPGIFVPSFKEALWVLLLLNLLAPESLAKCPRCSNRFTRRKTTQLFCSHKCGNNERKARQRTRQGDENEAGGQSVNQE